MKTAIMNSRPWSTGPTLTVAVRRPFRIDSHPDLRPSAPITMIPSFPSQSFKPSASTASTAPTAAAGGCFVLDHSRFQPSGAGADDRSRTLDEDEPNRNGGASSRGPHQELTFLPPFVPADLCDTIVQERNEAKSYSGPYAARQHGHALQALRRRSRGRDTLY